MSNSPASIASGVRDGGFSTVALDTVVVDLESGTVATFPLGDGTNPQPVFDRGIISVACEYFAKQPFRLASVTGSPDADGSFGSAMERDSLVGSTGERAGSYLSVALTFLEPTRLRISASKFAGGSITIDLPPELGLICEGDVEIGQTASPVTRPVVQIATFVLADEPGVAFTTWWMDTDWVVWRNFVSSLPVAMLPIVGFPEPGDDYWTPSTVRDVSARFPELDLLSYLSANHLK